MGRRNGRGDHQRERMSELMSIVLRWLKAQMSTQSTCHSPHCAFATDRYLVVRHEPCSRCIFQMALPAAWLDDGSESKNLQQPLAKKDRCAGKDQRVARLSWSLCWMTGGRRQDGCQATLTRGDSGLYHRRYFFCPTFQNLRCVSVREFSAIQNL